MATGGLVTYEHVTIMYSLPRSMTQWWRWFFRHGCLSLHDPMRWCSHPSDLVKVVKAAEGDRLFIADTSAIFFHERLHRLLPGHRRLYMVRHAQDCLASAKAQGYTFDAEDASRRLMRHAYGQDRNVRLHYGALHEDLLSRLFLEATGRNCEVKHPLNTHIDVPLRHQRRDIERTRQLLLHKDPA